MAQPATSSDMPPEYSQADPASVPAPDDICQPLTLRLADRFIHTAESHDSPALYELSLGVDTLREHHREVTIERLEYRVRGASAGEPQLASRKRLIFTLTRPAEITAPAFPYYLESESRQSIGNLGLKNLKPGLMRKKKIEIWKIVKDRTSQFDFVRREKLFDVKQSKERMDYEWTLSVSGVIIANESDEDGLHRLQIVMTTDRMTVDALIASWCLRLWQDLADQNRIKRVKGWRDGKTHMGLVSHVTNIAL
jgi:hypothetical protein